MAGCWPWVAVNTEGLVWEKVITFEGTFSRLVSFKFMGVTPYGVPSKISLKELALDTKDMIFFFKRYQ